MDKVPDTIKTIIDSYIAALKKSDIPIDAAFLFGSYSRGTSNEWSDIDVALVSDAFTGDRIRDRDRVRSFTRRVSSMIEVIPFARKDFNEGNPFALEIMRTGIKIL